MANLGSDLINWLGTQDAGAAAEMKTILDAVDELSSTEIGFLDGVTAGTATASKGLVLDGSKGIATITTATITTLTTNDITLGAAGDIDAVANTAAALEITDGTTAILAFDTRNTVTVQNVTVTQPASQTLPDGATSRFRLLSVAAPTVTLAGTTQVTTTNQGASLFVGGPTYNQSGGAVTVDQVSTLHIGAVTAGASVTITAPYMVSTGVSDCYLTNAGVWTDTACWSWGKDAIANATDAAIEGVLALLQPKSWKYRDDVHGHDFDRERVGIVYDELPEALRCPGQQSGVSAGVLSSFALAAIKMLYEKNKDLEARLARLGA